MKVVSGKDLCRILERHGWILLRIHGSHYYYGQPGSDVKVSVPVHRNQALKPGLLRGLLKLAGLSEEDL